MNLSYLEDFDSVIPAIQVLHALGWNYLSREEAIKLRNGRLDQVVLKTGLVKEVLAAVAFGNIFSADHRFLLKNYRRNFVVRQSVRPCGFREEKVYERCLWNCSVYSIV